MSALNRMQPTSSRARIVCRHPIACLLPAACFALAATVNAAPIIQTPGPPFDGSSTRPTTTTLFGILARVDVGAGDVDINQIGVYGDVTSNLNIKWLIFDDTQGSSPLLQSPTVALQAAGGAQWFDSPLLPSFALAANSTYWIGVAIDGPLNSFRRFWNNPGTPVSAGGLTLPADHNGNVRTSFANPTLDNRPGSVQASIRLFVPEPTSISLCGIVAIGCAASARRRRVSGGARCE